MSTRRKSTLFLIEQLIVIAIFALCAGICVSILTTSYIMATGSRDTANALIAAQNCAEAFKAAGGNAGAAVGMLGGGTASDNGPDFRITAYYDEDWRQIEFGGNENAAFILTLSGSEEPYSEGASIRAGSVTVDKPGGENLITLPVAARGAR